MLNKKRYGNLLNGLSCFFHPDAAAAAAVILLLFSAKRVIKRVMERFCVMCVCCVVMFFFLLFIEVSFYRDNGYVWALNQDQIAENIHL